MGQDLFYIPSNPPLIVPEEASQEYRDKVAANEYDALRVQSKIVTIIPPPPVDEQVPYIVPERRKFSQPLAEVRDDVFRSRR